MSYIYYGNCLLYFMVICINLCSHSENGHSEQGPLVDEFVKWCDEAFLQLNATKAKDMVIDFRRQSLHPPSQTFNKGTGIEFINKI